MGTISLLFVLTHHLKSHLNSFFKFVSQMQPLATPVLQLMLFRAPSFLCLCITSQPSHACSAMQPAALGIPVLEKIAFFALHCLLRLTMQTSLAVSVCSTNFLVRSRVDSLNSGSYQTRTNEYGYKRERGFPKIEIRCVISLFKSMSAHPCWAVHCRGWPSRMQLVSQDKWCLTML